MLVLRVVAVLSAQALERRDDFFLLFLHRVGDHTRGLFEADASIVVSAAHAFENVEIVFLSCHAEILSSGDSGKTYFLSCDQFNRRFRFTAGIHRDANANENPPSVTTPLAVKNDKSIFSHQSCRLRTMHETLELPAGASGQFERRRELLFICFELSMGQTCRKNIHCIAAKIFDFPTNIPTIRRRVARY